MLRTKTRGFSLIEILVVLVLMIPVALWIARTLSLQSQRTSTDNLIAAQAQEMVALNAAAQKYIGTVDGGWTAGAVNALGIQAMITGNFLPTGFANRNSAIGTSPLFQTYIVQAMLDATDKKPRILITLSGNPTPGRLAHFGMTQSVADILTYNQRVAEKVQAINAFAYGGVIANGTSTVTGNFGAFTKDVTGLLPAAPTFPTAAVLQGYPDLGPVGNTNPNASTYKACNVLGPMKDFATNSYTNPTCPANWDQVAQFPYCGSWNTAYTPQYAVWGSPVGDIILQSENDNSWEVGTLKSPCAPKSVLEDGSTCPTSGVWSHNITLNTNKVSTNVMLNGATVKTDTQCHNSKQVINPCAFNASFTCVSNLVTNCTACEQLTPAVDVLCCLPE